MLGKPVKFPHEIPGVETQGIITFFEFVKFFYYCRRDDYIIVLELSDASVVVQYDVGVKHKNFR